ncbi:MAG: methyltransferase, partial [Prevotellaceae bacterium]|nr:methyltransferase [Prevotellaceae bacterium]
MTPLSSFRQQLLALYPDGEARAVTRLVAEEKFHLGVTDLLLGKDSEMSEADKAEARNILTRLLKGEPVQYVLGTATFLGRRFTVGQGCLIPRPETEDLLSQTLGYLDEDKGELSFLDIGTGSGCIAISIALRSPRFKVTAWDISEEALQYARHNARANESRAEARFQLCRVPPSLAAGNARANESRAEACFQLCRV